MKRYTELLIAVLALGASVGYAGVFISENDEGWDAATDVAGWGLVGGHDGVMQITAPDSGDQFEEAYRSSPAGFIDDKFGGSNMTLTAGNPTYLSLDIRAQNPSPLDSQDALRLYFSTLAGQVWYYSVVGLSADWHTYTVPMAGSGMWRILGDGTWLDDLAVVQELGRIK